MGLFTFFNKKNGIANDQNSLMPATHAVPDVPKETFIEEDNLNGSSAETANSPLTEKNIDLLYQVLDRNHEAKGYDDALINPDASHLEQNIQSIKNELERTIGKVKTYYEDFMREIDFHIESRSRSGMIDMVEELKMKKEIAESHMRKIVEIEESAQNNLGAGLGITMSYTRGFKNGLAAISHHSILKRKL